MGKAEKSAWKCCWLALTALLAACGDGSSEQSMLRLELVATGLSSPVFITAPPQDNTRLFVVEKSGVIRIIDRATGQVLATPFIDLTSQIDSSGEQGLLGLAFHPNFTVSPANRFFYVYLSNLSGDSEVRRYTVPAGTPNVADIGSGQLIISVAQPAATNHKAGWLAFGQDGFLYIALGDGGSTPANGQDLTNLLGKILRLDVTTLPFTVPPDNPFAGAGPERDEIWAYGLRNPFRNSFDRLTGDLYIADVGQNSREEVNVATLASGGGSGVNYGWNTMEGSLCFSPMTGCNTAGLALPVVEYDHNQGCSITGGYVYRGSAMPQLRGTYFYGDFCQGFVRSFRLFGGQATEQAEWPALDPGSNLTSFGEDAAGELYITTLGGDVYRIVQ